MSDPYYKTRYTYDPVRTKVWREITGYLKKFIPANASVLDLGAGYCDFANNIKAGKVLAVDTSPESKNYAKPGISFLSSVCWELKPVANLSVNVVHASNLLEHLDDDELKKTMLEVRRVLKKDGLLILLQPNFKYTYKKYFDDPTHKKIFTDVSLENFLESHNFEVIHKKPKFLPFSVKSKPSFVPVSSALIKFYIYSPFKPFAGQMLFIARKK